MVGNQCLLLTPIAGSQKLVCSIFSCFAILMLSVSRQVYFKPPLPVIYSGVISAAAGDGCVPHVCRTSVYGWGAGRPYCAPYCSLLPTAACGRDMTCTVCLMQWCSTGCLIISLGMWGQALGQPRVAPTLLLPVPPTHHRQKAENLAFTGSCKCGCRLGLCNIYLQIGLDGFFPDQLTTFWYQVEHIVIAYLGINQGTLHSSKYSNVKQAQNTEYHKFILLQLWTLSRSFQENCLGLEVAPIQPLIWFDIAQLYLGSLINSRQAILKTLELLKL